MNKTAIKNFAIWARNKLIADISYRAGLMGITPDGIHPALPQSTGQTKFYDIGTAEPYAISGEAIRQREHLADLIRRKAKDSNYQTAYKYIIEEVAYTWFNRLIAVRFMEVNDYLPSHIRVLSSDQGKIEPDLVTTPFDADLDFTRDEQQTIMDLKSENKLDELFRLLFIKQCNALNEILPALFEKTDDYTELLLNLSVIDQDGVVYHLVHDIPEEDFDIERGGQVEIIGWLYQYYNTEPKNAAFAKKGKITKEEIPAVTQLFTPDWIVRYMVENSLGRLWIEHLIACGDSRTETEIASDFGWKYYLSEAEQEPEVAEQLRKIREERKDLMPEVIRCIDPCMGSGHICVYLFSVLMQIYESAGYGQREAAKSILENNLYGLDIDDRAFQMAYFAVMMKAREYNRRILNGENRPNLYSIQESNEIDREQLKFFGRGMEKAEREAALRDMTELLDTFVDAKEYGSLLTVKMYDWDRLVRLVEDTESEGQISFESVGLEETYAALIQLIEQARCLAQNYDVTTTNPPYFNMGSASPKLSEYVKKHYSKNKADLFAIFIEKCLDVTKENGILSMITMQGWMFLSSYEYIRGHILRENILSLLQFGIKAFEEIGNDIVQTATFTVRKAGIREYLTSYFRLLDRDRDDKEKNYLMRKNIFFAKSKDFLKIPGTPIAYWISDKTKDTFEHPLVADMGKTVRGYATASSEKYMRKWYEVSINNIAFGCKSNEDAYQTGKRWFPYNKGGFYKKWYGNNEEIIDYFQNGDSYRNIKGFCFSNQEFYFQESVTWTKVCTGRISLRYNKNGFIFGDAGPALLANSHEDLMVLLGVLNSKVAEKLLTVINPTLNYTNEAVGNVPVYCVPEMRDRLITLVEHAIDLMEKDWNLGEISWGFKRHYLVQEGKLTNIYKHWEKYCNEQYEDLLNTETEINDILIKSFGLDEIENYTIDDRDICTHRANIKKDIVSLISYAVGCILGRYSLQHDGVHTALEYDKTSYFDEDGIIPITDEEYFEDDIVSKFIIFIKAVYGENNLESNLDFIAHALGRKGDTSRRIIRDYFVNDFFADHCGVYTTFGTGKRPIYWLFDAGTENGFKALIYLHRYNADTIGNLRIDYLHRMQRIYESEIMRMQDMIDNSTNNREVAQATKRREKLTKQLKECREYDEKLAHLALSRIELDLDDGVKVNYRKLQTANDGKFYEVLADSKNIMAKK